jgi:PAS domain S-box-containing protein
MTIRNKIDFQQRLLKNIQIQSSFIRLFDALPDTCFFAKDRKGRFIMANRVFLEKLGLDKQEDLIGMNDSDFFPSHQIEIFHRDDQWVLQTGQPLKDRVELVSNKEGRIDWHITTKVPLVSGHGYVVGVAGVTRVFRNSDESWSPHQQFSKLIQFINSNYKYPIQIEKLADIMCLSVNQFERNFKKVFQIAPIKFLIRYRIHKACYDLLHSDQSVTCIAQNNGFYDHSHFIRYFRQTMGMTPNQYRNYR